MADSAITPVLPQLVYYRPAGYTDGAADDWKYAPNVRCESVQCKRGAGVGSATITYIPQDSTQQPVEIGLSAYPAGTQFRVVVLPQDDEGVQQGDAVNDGYILHEGELIRPVADINKTETVQYISQPLPAAIDDTIAGHVITGRWALLPGTDESDPELAIINCNSTPAVFNFGGRANMGTINAIKATSPTTISANVFTDEYDPAALFWTVREALVSLIVVWLLGASYATASEENNLPRHSGIEADTLTALTTPEPGSGSRDDRWDGLDAKLPETNVHGLGVLSAIEAVCKAGGFEMSVEPAIRLTSDATVHAFEDRTHLLRIWRKGSGPLTWYNLAKRGSSYQDAPSAYAENDMNRLRIMFDYAELANHITTSGREWIEAWHVIKPMWAPDELVPLETLTAELASTQITDELLQNEYFKWHHPRGSMYNPIALRHWGLMTVPFAGTYYPEPGDGEADYEQDPNGHDFVTALGLDASDAYFGAHGQARWMRRRRLAVALKSKEALAKGQRFILQVSEDAGTTWQACYAPFSTLPGDFGIELKISNFASVNNASFPNGDHVTDVNTSWFALIRDKLLTFRLLCAIESDDALRYTAAAQTSSGSPYQRAMLDLADCNHVWLGPEHVNATAADYVSDDETVKHQVQTRAEIMRGRYEQARVSGNASTFRMDLIPSYKLGYRIQSIHGRNISLASDRAGKRAPSIVSITYNLTGKRQGISLHLADMRMGAMV